MQKRKFGNTGLEVSILGYGAGHIGAESLSETEAEIILNTVVDSGINLIDTARAYGLSEERIGKYLSHRRKDIIISTKVGYGVEGYEDWTYDAVKYGIDRALKTMKTDYLDIVNLHSCPKNILVKHDVIKALWEAKVAGKIRVTAYSGENEELDYAISSNLFQGIECSLNLCDQLSLTRFVPNAVEKGIGIIAKRPIANAPWRYDTQPYGEYCEEYWKRLQKMKFSDFGMDYNELFLRFALSAPGISSAIVGSTNLLHITKNVEISKKEKLDYDIYTECRKIFMKEQNNWLGQI